MKRPEEKIRLKEYWECDLCNINNTAKRMCPCPRGGYEAENKGYISTHITFKLYPQWKKKD